jgi:uncharacterized membrane protein YbhN (UPF0104 family)
VTLKRLSILIPLVMLPLGIWLGYWTFRDHSLTDIANSVAGIPSVNLALAFAFAAASYLCLTGFDTLAVRYVGHSLPYHKIALTSFVSLSIGHNVGVAVLSSGTLRYRFYSGFGLGAVEIGEIILFCALTVGLGLISLGGLILVLRPDFGLGTVGLAPAAARAAGILCLALVTIYVLLAWRLRRPLCLRGHEFRMPNTRIAAAQIAVGTANFAFVAATLHQLLAGAAGYPEMVAAYVLGNVTALLSHVPGGLGVLEFVIASLMAHGNLVGALIAFRIVYFLVPLVLGSTLLITAEFARWRAG